MRHVLVVFDGNAARRDIIDYAVELARRTQGSISILVLVDSLTPCRGVDLKEELESLISAATERGIEARGEIRFGDKTSEFLKYMAGAPSFHTLVWGGDRMVIEKRAPSSKEHWFARVANSIDCAIVAPAIRQ